MPNPLLYSANPWFATEIASKYRGGNYFAWVCEYFDTDHAPHGSAGALIAPSSNPRKIYYDLLQEYHAQEEHSRIIRDHKRTFRRLAKKWLADGEINDDQFAEIVASVKAISWRIWKPVLYVIPRMAIDAGRIKEVPRNDRAGYGPELQIADLQREEFDIVDLSGLVPSK
jgi:hypothetical protein